MRVLIVFCHPNPESYSAHLRDVAVETFEARGAEVRVRDLYALGFEPVMSRAERLGYHDEGDNEVPVAEELAHLKWCDTLVFMYPTWWFGLPAMLKGYLDRVLVPYATFRLPTADEPMQPGLTNIVRLAAFTTCGARWLQSKFVGEPGRRTLLRGVRHVCHPRCKTRYAALYKIDTASLAQRQRHATVLTQLIAKL